jgi:hypothetical protein
MDDERMNDREPNDDELAQRLEAYAVARLSPDRSAMARMRVRVMAMAREGAPAREAGVGRADTVSSVAVPAAALFEGRRRSPWRRSAALLLAAGLTLALGVGSVAATQPGGPLYGARIWAETLTLPSTAAERAQAEVRRLDERLSEAAAATVAGNTDGANAALDAYEAIVNEATSDAGNDVSAAATLETGVRSNIDVLTVLAGRAPEHARDAIQQVIDRSDTALDAMHGQRNDAPSVDPTPAATDKPERTPNPNKPTPDPADTTTKSNPTPKPDHTPGGPPFKPPANGGGSSQGNGQGNGQGN